MMPIRSLPTIHGHNGAGWTDPALTVIETGGRKKLYKTWFSPEGSTWEPADKPNPTVDTPNYSVNVSAAAASHSQINVSWTATSGATYKLYRTSGPSGTGPLPNGSTSLSYADTGLNGSTSYSYRVDVLVGGLVVTSGYASATTAAAPPPPPPPTSSASQNGPALISSGGWTSCTAKTLYGPTFGIAGYVSSFNLFFGAQSGTGHFDPFVNGARLGYQDVTGGKTWRHVDGRNTHVGGSCQVGAYTGGNCNYSTAWQTYSGQGSNWGSSVACGTINYWWYTRSADEEVLRSQPWWDDELLDGREIHMESWVDHDGVVWKVRVVDKRLRNVLVEWESSDGPVGGGL